MNCGMMTSKDHARVIISKWWTKPWSAQILTFSNFADFSLPEHKMEMDILEAMHDASAYRWYPWQRIDLSSSHTGGQNEYIWPNLVRFLYSMIQVQSETLSPKEVARGLKDMIWSKLNGFLQDLNVESVISNWRFKISKWINHTPVYVTIRHWCHVTWTFNKWLTQISETFDTLSLLYSLIFTIH